MESSVFTSKLRSSTRSRYESRFSLFLSFRVQYPSYKRGVHLKYHSGIQERALVIERIYRFDSILGFRDRNYPKTSDQSQPQHEPKPGQQLVTIAPHVRKTLPSREALRVSENDLRGYQGV